MFQHINFAQEAHVIDKIIHKQTNSHPQQQQQQLQSAMLHKGCLQPLLATDIGGVLKEHKRFKGDDQVRWIKHAEWALSKLAKRRKLYIISHVKPENTERLRNMLRGTFVERYIPEERWHFVHERYHKIYIMQKFSIPTLIDDRRDIIQWVTEAGLCGIRFGSNDFPNWKTVVRQIKKGKTYLPYDGDGRF